MDIAGKAALHLASEKGHAQVVELLKEVEGIDVNRPDKDGVTPLYVASQNGHLEVVRYLAGENGASVDQIRRATRPRTVYSASIPFEKKNEK